MTIKGLIKYRVKNQYFILFMYTVYKKKQDLEDFINTSVLDTVQHNILKVKNSPPPLSVVLIYLLTS